MLLRWLVNNYLREATQGQVRATIGELAGQALQPATPDSRPPTPDPRPPTPDSDPTSTAESADEFLPCDVAFIFALGIESGGLVDLLGGAQRSRQRHGTEHAGKLAGREVVIVESGVGAKAAAQATAEAIKFYRPAWVVSAGFAGALDEKLRRGHIVMADEIADLSGKRFDVGLKLDAQATSQTRGLSAGRVLTVDHIVSKPAERRQLATKHGAIACDMESLGVAEACREHGARFMSVRIITDALDDELPPEIEHLLVQKTIAGKLGAAAGAVMRRFSAAKDLWKLREDALKASDRLAKFLVGVIQQLTTDN